MAQGGALLLSTKRGKAARFTFADLLALAVTNELVNTFGVHIAVLRNGVDAVFQLLERSDASQLEHTTVFVTVNDAALFDAERREADRMPAEPALMIPLAPLIAAIQRQMLPIEPVSSQGILPFLPEAVRSHA